MFKTFRYAAMALRSWTRWQILVAVIASIGIGLLIGIATVLIPNPVFARDIATVWWNYPVWIFTSLASGLLVATYIRLPASGPSMESAGTSDRQGKLGLVGGLLAWFAVGCPVCNKLALIALGYSGAITYFAPIQPFLGIGALLLTSVAVLSRLKGQIVCKVTLPTPGSQASESTPGRILI